MSRYYIKTSTKGYDLFTFGGYYGFTLILIASFSWPEFIQLEEFHTNPRPTQEASTYG